jgi:hypothetical protein
MPAFIMAKGKLSVPIPRLPLITCIRLAVILMIDDPTGEKYKIAALPIIIIILIIIILIIILILILII